MNDQKTLDAPPNAVKEKVEAPKPRLSIITITYDHDSRALGVKVVAKDKLTVDGMLTGAQRELDQQELINKISAAADAPRIIKPGSPEGIKTALAAEAKA